MFDALRDEIGFSDSEFVPNWKWKWKYVFTKTLRHDMDVIQGYF